MEGNVKWYNRKKGYGFIIGEDGQEYFVHFSAIAQGTFLRDNDKVSFEPAETDKGRQAQKVALLQKASEKESTGEEASEASEESEEPEESEDEEDSEEE